MIETKYNTIPNELFDNYLHSLINRIYKILPLKEENSKTVSRYIESLLSEMTGSTDVILFLKSDEQYLSIINTLEYICFSKDIALCKREIFKCIHIVENLIEKYC